MITLEEVSKIFGTTAVVDRVTLHVEEGEMFVLLGGSGSGKTTTLKMVNRLIEPTSGKIRLAGRDVTAEPAHVIRRRVGYVFQRIGLFPHMTIAENIAVTPALLGWDERRIEARVDALLELVELDPALVRDRYPSELSGGQAQRVGVARALAAEPRVMLLDEPFGALDPLTRDRLQQSLLRIRRELGLTAMFVTHDLSEACLLADRIAILRGGRLVQVGTPAEIAASPADAEVAEWIGTPRRRWEETVARLAGAEAPS
jgi:osmoprotectant transport system ATP-binding protein